MLSVSELACTVGLRPLFSGLNFDLPAGQWLRLTGPNGCGKSTLLRTLGGLLRPTDGQVLWRGRRREPGSPDWRREMLYQGHASGWKDVLTAGENLSLQIELDRGFGPTVNEIDSGLDAVGLLRQRHLPFQRLSAGQRHRLSLARLHASHQTLWLLDEPTTALDAAGQQQFGELLDGHLARGGCAIVATHLPIECRAPAQPLELARFARRR